MALIIVDVENNSDIEKLIPSFYMFKGVKRVSLEEDLFYPKLDESLQQLENGEHSKQFSNINDYEFKKTYWYKMKNN
jgi:hypothetical protein